jgi:hypothetical protein
VICTHSDQYHQLVGFRLVDMREDPTAPADERVWLCNPLRRSTRPWTRIPKLRQWRRRRVPVFAQAKLETRLLEVQSLLSSLEVWGEKERLLALLPARRA